MVCQLVSLILRSLPLIVSLAPTRTLQFCSKAHKYDNQQIFLGQIHCHSVSVSIRNTDAVNSDLPFNYWQERYKIQFGLCRSF